MLLERMEEQHLNRQKAPLANMYKGEVNISEALFSIQPMLVIVPHGFLAKGDSDQGTKYKTS